MNLFLKLIILFLLANSPQFTEVPTTTYLYTPNHTEEDEKFLSLTKSITEKVFEIEKLHARIVPYNHTMQTEIIIDNHIQPFTYERGEKVRYEKETILCFTQNRLTKVEILSKKRYINNNSNYKFKKFIFIYPDYNYSKLIVDNLDGHSLQYLKYFTEENKKEALEKVDKNLQESIYKLEVLLFKYEKRRSFREKQKLDI